MIWEVDDRSTGVITLDAIRKVCESPSDGSALHLLTFVVCQLLKRLQKAKKRMPGTGTNLLRTLIEFMMFDRLGSCL